MKILFSLLAAFLILAPCSAKPPESSRSFLFQYDNVLGTSMELKVFTTSTSASSRAEAAVLAEISRLSAILSGYDANSEFSRWLHTLGTPVRVSPELYEVLALFDRWRDRTNGAVDASAEAVTRCWRQAATRQRLPTKEELAAAISLVREQHWRLDPVNHTATHLSTAPLMLNSFAKSFIIRHAADAGLAAATVDAIIVNIGGDLVIAGNHTENVLVSDPRSDAENDLPLDRLRLSNRAVATSGSYRRGEMIDGKWYSHIVDPRTGIPAGRILSATVIAPAATDAGALATAFNVMDTEESVRLAATLPGIDYLIITSDGRRLESPGWKKIELPAVAASPSTQPSTDFELLVSLELSLQQGVAKRPYLAAWVEDENHAPVRTFALWHGSERYLPELRSWYLKYRGRYSADKSFAASVTSATRSAGKYTIKWDGKDDQGAFVKPGKYVVKIEVSREHGTYQLMRQELDWNGSPQKFMLNGNTEIAGLSLDYRKKTNEN
ncbi:MAG: DUF2271 domain-containing protein [Bacteroidetes bacterium]|nr:DUF2271 domain-containing protein [Bacteroidota bacterium]